MSEHYELIRTSPEYRNFLMMEEMLAEMQPSIAQNPVSDKESIKEGKVEVIYRFIQVPYKKKRTYKDYTY